MPRQSSALEEHARDLLVHFLESNCRRPLATLLGLVFSGKVPQPLLDLPALEIHTEYPSIGRSRVDILIKNRQCLLCLEVKVDAVEQVGQYLKYQEYFANHGYTVYVAGLVNRFKRFGSRNNNEPFLEHLQIPRILWFELLGAFQSEFAHLPAFKTFRSDLRRLHSGIGAHIRAEPSASAVEQDCSVLACDTRALSDFFNALRVRFPKWDGKCAKYGNAPYSLYLGNPQWGPLFNERCCRRIVVGFNNGRKCQRLAEPYFALAIMLWDRTWFSEKGWFLEHRVQIAGHFQKLGFEVIRNDGSHRNTPWPPPFQDTSSLHFANAFWEEHFSLPEAEYRRLGWKKSLARLEQEIRKIAKMIDLLSPILSRHPRAS